MEKSSKSYLWYYTGFILDSLIGKIDTTWITVYCIILFERYTLFLREIVVLIFRLSIILTNWSIGEFRIFSLRVLATMSTSNFKLSRRNIQLFISNIETLTCLKFWMLFILLHCVIIVCILFYIYLRVTLDWRCSTSMNIFFINPICTMMKWLILVYTLLSLIFILLTCLAILKNTIWASNRRQQMILGHFQPLSWLRWIVNDQWCWPLSIWLQLGLVKLRQITHVMIFGFIFCKDRRLGLKWRIVR